MYSTHYTVYVNYTLHYTIQCTLHTIQYNMYTIHYVILQGESREREEELQCQIVKVTNTLHNTQQSLREEKRRYTGYNILYTGWAKSQFTYVGLNSSVTECSNEIILSGMTYYHHWFEEFVKSKHICVHFFQMKVHFRIYLIVWIVGSSQILLDCFWPFE